jgi:uncharacterized protein YndB with AHSA1/START domain
MAVSVPTDTSILITREFAAPRQAVYRAVTEPELVRRWWGGGDGVVVAEIDLRVGGGWRFEVAGDGYVVGLHGVYREIVPGALIRCTEVYEGAPDPEDAAALCTYTFRDAPRGSSLALLTELPTPDDRDALLDSGVEEGTQASWEQLERVALSLG